MLRMSFTETACSEQPITVLTASKLVHENRQKPFSLAEKHWQGAGMKRLCAPTAYLTFADILCGGPTTTEYLLTQFRSNPNLATSHYTKKVRQAVVIVNRCAYGTCKSDSRNPKSLKGGVILFPFPKPKTQEERCQQWIKQCGKPHSQLNTSKINKHTFVCSKREPPLPEHLDQLEGCLGRSREQKNKLEENNLKMALKETEVERLKAHINTLSHPNSFNTAQSPKCLNRLLGLCIHNLTNCAQYLAYQLIHAPLK
ncbi:hypothetical protein N1851_015643 [Merluccius polli]|uniref:THAP-type domain-containing protein n=1 Tax=Merluccius polli TaxID=89951 RepID=A0AA47MSN9_MERPO|nr:hypothetical protein N1851_015643 [Merluccius polli]